MGGWVSWIAASLDYPGCNFVTIGMDRVEFKKNVRKGTILRFSVNRANEGKTSAQYTVNVNSESVETGESELIFSTNITFVRIDETGKKMGLPCN